MENRLSNIKQEVERKKKPFKRILKVLQKKNDKLVDQYFHAAHDSVFSKIDCLACANCCKTTGPLFTNNDIDRIAKRLRLKAADFIEKYLRIDEDHDYVLQSVPCTFLASDNYCSIYEDRPKACREYPHTDRKKQKPLFALHMKNTKVCPAVIDVMEIVESNL